MADPAATPDITFEATHCALCGPGAGCVELYPATLTPSAVRVELFSARRAPDRLHHRIVRCAQCCLVRSDPVIPAAALAKLYAGSEFTYEGEVGNLRRTYGRYLARMQRHGDVGALLEVGCGDGFFLEEALARGVKQVRGIEPGTAQVEHAAPAIRPHLDIGIMSADAYPPESFDGVCLFQVLDHLPDPVGVLEACRAALRPSGLILCLNHDVEALSARLLGERSPIYDLQHTYLYSKRTLRLVLEKAGFRIVEEGAAWNTVSLSHLAHLARLPRPGPLSSLAVRLPLGNLYALAVR